MSMSNLNLRPTTASPTPSRVSGSSAPTRTASTTAPQQTQAAPVSQEARQLARHSQAPSTPSVATDADIQGIKSEIANLTSALPTVDEFATTANTLQDSPVTKAGLRAALTFLGQDHPRAAALQTQLTQAGDDPTKLITLRNTLVDTIRSLGREVSAAQPSRQEAVEQQLAPERTPTDDRWLIRKAIMGGRDRSAEANAQQGRLSELATLHTTQAGDFTKLANRLQDSPVNASAIRGAIAVMSDNPQTARLKAELTAAGNDPAKLLTLRNNVVDTLRAESRRLTGMSQGELQASDRINTLAGEGYEELIANTSLATSVVSSTNSLVKLVEGAASQGFMGAATAAVGVGFGGLQIVTEAVALRRNVNRLDEALTRRESAQLILAPAADRANMITEMRTQIESLSKPSFFRTKSGREADIAKLQAKIEALSSMGATESTTEAKAIAQQVVDTTSVKFKALRVLKNVVGIAAGAVAIAVAVGALATPIGWAAAGVALAATAGLWIYNKVQTSNKETKITNLMENRTQISQQIAELQTSPAARNPESPQGKALAGLQELQQKNMVQLLTVSPRHAANLIIDGLKATPQDVQMRVLATQVLNVPQEMTVGPFSPHQEGELREYMMRGMPMQPKL